MSADPISPPPSEADAEPEPRWGRDSVWVSTTYFAEGLPYALVNNVADAMFTLMGASLSTIGLTSLFHLPWNLKFLWGPLLDTYETKRWWLWGCELVLAVLVLGLAFASQTDAVLATAGLVFVLISIVSATHDIAVDGYYLEALDKAGQSRFVGLRVTGYRIAMLAGFGGFLMVAGATSWPIAWLSCAAALVGLAVFHARFLPRPEVRKRPASVLAKAVVRPPVLLGGAVLALVVVAERRLGWLGGLTSTIGGRAVAAQPWLAKISVSGWIGMVLLTLLMVTLAFLPSIRRRIAGSDSNFARAYVSFLAQADIGRALAFIVLFRLGESFLLKMRTPFLLNEVQMSESDYGLLTATVGVIAGIAGSVAGGLLIAKHGLRRWIWPFVLAQNGLNLLYMVVALEPDPSSTSTLTLAAVIVAENIGAGLGTAVFMVYIMRCCAPGHRAAHMAIVTALMSVGFTLAGVTSGFIAEATGFGTYFGFTFLATIPSMLLIPFVPHLDDTEPPASEAPANPTGAEPGR